MNVFQARKRFEHYRQVLVNDSEALRELERKITSRGLTQGVRDFETWLRIRQGESLHRDLNQRAENILTAPLPQRYAGLRDFWGSYPIPGLTVALSESAVATTYRKITESIITQRLNGQISVWLQGDIPPQPGWTMAQSASEAITMVELNSVHRFRLYCGQQIGDSAHVEATTFARWFTQNPSSVEALWVDPWDDRYKNQVVNSILRLLPDHTQCPLRKEVAPELPVKL